MAAPVTLAVIDHRLKVAQQALALRARQGNIEACERLQAYLDQQLDARLLLVPAEAAHAT